MEGIKILVYFLLIVGTMIFILTIAPIVALIVITIRSAILKKKFLTAPTVCLMIISFIVLSYFYNIFQNYHETPPAVYLEEKLEEEYQTGFTFKYSRTYEGMRFSEGYDSEYIYISDEVPGLEVKAHSWGSLADKPQKIELSFPKLENMFPRIADKTRRNWDCNLKESINLYALKACGGKRIDITGMDGNRAVAAISEKLSLYYDKYEELCGIFHIEPDNTVTFSIVKDGNSMEKEFGSADPGSIKKNLF